MIPTISELRKQQRKNHTYFRGKHIGPKESTYYYPFLSYFFIVRYLRFFSLFFTKIFLHLNITANQVTLLTVILGVISAILLGFNVYTCTLVAMVIIQLVHILDCSDGEVSRYRNTQSHSGDYLDMMQHWLTESLVFLFLGFGLFKEYGRPELIVIGGIIALSFLLRELYTMSSTFICVELKVVGFEDKLTNKKIKKENRKDSFFVSAIYKLDSLTNFFLCFHGVSSVLLIFSIFDLLIIPFLFYGFAQPIAVIAGLINEFYAGPQRGLSRLRKIKNKI